MKKIPKIIQHVAGTTNSGGPIVALNRILSSNLLTSFELFILEQKVAARGINIPLLYHFTKKIKNIKPNMIHVRGLGNEGFHGVFAAKLAGVPNILISVHGTHRDLIHSKWTLRKWLVCILEMITLFMATDVITVCEYASKRKFIVRHRKKFLGVVNNGVTLPNRPLSDVRELNRCKFNIPDMAVVAVCVSRITMEKGFLELAAALKLLPALVHPLKIFIVGDGPDRISIERAMKDILTCDICFLGHRDDIDDILSVADFFLFPSLHENLSNALLEAMSHSLPAIAFDVGGNREVLGSGGGQLIEPRNTENFSKAIFQYVMCPKLRFDDGMLARKIIEEKFTLNNMVQKLNSVYLKILNSANS